MTDPQVGMLMLALFLFVIMLGFPIAFTLIAMGVGFGFYAYFDPTQAFFENRVFTLLVQKTFEVTSNDQLIAVHRLHFVTRSNLIPSPFFLLADASYTAPLEAMRSRG